MWFRHRHRGHPEDTGGGFSERGEDFYPAIREDIQLATRENSFMAMDNQMMHRMTQAQTAKMAAAISPGDPCSKCDICQSVPCWISAGLRVTL